MKRNPFTFWHLLVRSFLPSSASLIIGSVITFCVVGAQVLLLSLKQGAMVPHVFAAGSRNSWPTVYDRYILDPVAAFMANDTVNTVLMILLWAIGGWMLFLVATSVIGMVRTMREDQDAVYVPTPDQVIHHPLHHSIIMRLVWRTGIVLIAGLVTVLAVPIVGGLLSRVETGSYAGNPAGLVVNILIIYFGWMGVMHAYIVLLRLFLFRTRVHAEIVE